MNALKSVARTQMVNNKLSLLLSAELCMVYIEFFLTAITTLYRHIQIFVLSVPCYEKNRLTPSCNVVLVSMVALSYAGICVPYTDCDRLVVVMFTVTMVIIFL